MAVPYTFGSATSSIPLSQLDSNFATTITLGNTAIQLGNTVTTLNNITLANVTISSGTSNLAATSISNGTSNVTVNSSGGNITLGTAGTTAITVDTSQNVGIGTASPARRLHVKAAGVTTLANSNGALFTDASNAGVLLGSDNVLGYVQGVTVAGTATVDLSLQPFGGNVLLGATSTLGSAKLTIKTPDGSGSLIPLTLAVGLVSDGFGGISFRNPNGAQGGVSINSTSVSYNTTSDYRLKEDVQPMTGALAKVAQLKPVTYKWKINGRDSEGFIAHELAEVCPQAVTGEKDALDEEGNPKYQGIDTSFLVATLTAAIQEQQALITAQAATINALTARIVALEAK